MTPREQSTELTRAQEEIGRLERLLHHRAAELEAIVDLIPVGIAVADDAEGSSIRVNRTGADLLGLAPGSNVSQKPAAGKRPPYQVIQHGQTLLPDEMPIQRCLASGEAVRDEEVAICRTGGPGAGTTVDLVMSVSPLFDGEERVRGAVAAFTDITRSKEDRRTAEIRARQQAVVADLGLSALVASTLDQVFDEAVHAVHETLGVELIKILELRPDGETLLLRAGRGWEGGLVGRAVLERRGSQAGYTLEVDTPVRVENLASETRFDASPILLDHGVSSGVSVVIRGREGPWGVFGAHTRRHRRFTDNDVHFIQSVANVVTAALERDRIEGRLRQSQRELALKAARERLRRAERLAAIGTLAAGIAHEINNPVNSILMTAEGALLALERGGDLARLRQDLEVIIREAERCGGITKNVMGFAREEGAEKSPHDFNRVVSQAAELTSRHVQQAGARLVLELGDDLPAPRINRTELEQVVVNLIQNAVEAGDGGDAATTITLATSRQEGSVVMTVSDDGPGMDDELAQRAFDPFFTTRRERGGTGLGLSLVHAIIQEHGGSIDVDSRPGAGTTFQLVLPAEEAREP